MFDALHAGNDFERLGLTPQFPIPEEILDTAFRERQRAYHPDQFASSDTAQQHLATQASAQINDAYRRLREPLSCAEALFTVRFQADALQSAQAQPDFLEQLLDWREAAEEAKTAKNAEMLQSLMRTIDTAIAADRHAVAIGFQHNDKKQVAGRLVQWHYLEKFKTDLESMLDIVLE